MACECREDVWKMIKETVDRGYCLHLSDMGEHKVEESRGMGEFLFFALLTFSPLPFLKKKFDCRIIALHYCVSICCTAASAMGIHMSLPFEPPSHLLPIPTFWVVTDHQVLAPCIIQQIPTGYLSYAWWCICFSVTLSIHPSLFFPHCVHKFVLYVWVSIVALQVDSSVPSFRFHIYALIYDICFLFLTYFTLCNRL